MRKPNGKPAIIALLAFLILSSIFALLIGSVRESIRQEEQMRLLERFVRFQTEVEALFNRNVILIKGFTTYVLVSGDPSGTESEAYLSTLIGTDTQFIRNVSLLEDTTIIYAYPMKGNEAAIGRNLAEIPAQRDAVLEAKSTMQLVVQGPIDLVQGGTGIITRIPFLKDGRYWGQVSVVLDGEAFLQHLRAVAAANGIEVALFQEDQYPDKPFIGDAAILADEPLTQHMSLSNLHWIAAVMPDRGWDNRTGLYLTAGLGAFALALLLSVLLFQSLNAHTRIREESIVDHLTGLYNRRFLEEYQILLLGRAARNDSKVAILMIDLDRFKTINDRYGHKAGDELLKAVCERMRTVCRATEALFRLGGDEFLILFPDVNDMTFMPAIIDRLREVIAKPVLYAGHALQVEPSIGLAMYPDHGTTLDALMQHADRRMYEEKDVHRQASVPPMNGSDTPK